MPLIRHLTVEVVQIQVLCQITSLPLFQSSIVDNTKMVIWGNSALILLPQYAYLVSIDIE